MSSEQVWFVTGCSSGFGAELVLEILRRGQRCIATARDVSKLDSLKKAGAETMQFDVTAPLAVLQQKAQQASAIYGRIDFLINNAGYVLSGTMEESTPEETQAQFDTNVFGLLNTTRAFLPTMREQRSGVIANFSSIGGWMGWAGAGNYCASKFAVTGISESLHAELSDFGIKVCSVEPGYFRSRLLNEGQRKGGQDRRIEDYAGTTADKVYQMLVAADNHQPGDVQKGVKVLVDILSGRDGKDVPVRIVLGSDAYGYVKQKCEETLALLEEWKDITTATDHDDVHK